ncbi:class D sortase [Anoxynatronum buryatiense]|uniref:Sortase A n=1 Tax=Anoxynatronum buryatiense TaxID=489973 RepID=A0AA46AK73_9CLOT|nr:class D sortase [Anoxynatronum buryatiense]SMP68017.1 sortase A [Anoxynatronum buryatiense]
MRKFSTILIIAGLVIALYPAVNRYIEQREEARLMAELEEQLTQMELERETVEAYQELQEMFTAYDEEEQGFEASPEEIRPAEEGALLGSLEIPAIDAKMPVVQGASDHNLKTAAALLDGTSPIGSIGNAAIAAHRSHTYGRFFNRLNEVKLGDTIHITTPEETYVYRVYEIKVVEPTDLSVLNRNSRDKVVTLITCDPIYVASHRLIIHGVMVESEEEENDQTTATAGF